MFVRGLPTYCVAIRDFARSVSAVHLIGGYVLVSLVFNY